MKNLLTIITLGTLLLTFAQPSFSNEMQPLVQESRKVVKDFMGTLKQTMMASMKKGGAVAAIADCNLKAPEIAAEKSSNQKMQIGRTSLKVRNQGNKPDAWELKALKAFEQRKKAGEDVTKMEFSEIISQEGKKTFRYMKAIPTGKVCLKCHGASLQKGIAEKLDDLYPQDQARGFSEGDIRGAFTLQKEL